MATNTLIVNQVEYSVPFPVENWTVGDELHLRFKNEARKILPVTEWVIHETVTSTALSTVKVLAPSGRNLGVHFIVAPNGLITQHGDLATDLLWHGSIHNPYSVGVEVVNPFMPKGLPRPSPWTTVIQAPWAVGGQYVVPTPAQAEAVTNLTRWLTLDCPAPELTIPFNYVGCEGGVMRMGNVARAAKPGPGIYAHHYFGHGDGAWLVLYTWLRLRAELSPDDSYREAVRLATGAKPSGIDVTGLVGLVT